MYTEEQVVASLNVSDISQKRYSNEELALEEEDIEDQSESEPGDDDDELEAYSDFDDDLPEAYLKTPTQYIDPDPNEDDIDLFLNTRSSVRYIESFDYSIKKERITLQEFSLLYLDHVIQFVCRHIAARTGYHDISRYRYCITRDRHAPNFIISDKELMTIASRIMDLSHPYKVLFLTRVEACAIHCRTLIHQRTLENRRNQIYFLQVHMGSKECTLILNHIPATQDKDSPLSEEQWEGMYKHVKTKHVLMDVMDQICNYLWTHLQLYPKLVTRCCRHRHAEKLFKLNNRHVFKRKIQSYLSKVGKKKNKQTHTLMKH